VSAGEAQAKRAKPSQAIGGDELASGHMSW